MRRRIMWLKVIGFVLLCVAIFIAGHMLDSDIKWVAIPLVIVLLILVGPL